jgi:hypothetical protein
MKIIVSVITLAVAVTVAHPQPVHADRVRRPRVPADLKVDPAYKAFLEGHATGSQNYICLPSGTSFAWTLFTPQATLFEDNENQIITHFLSANPLEGGVARATWLHSKDSSAVWAVATDIYTLPDFVAPGAIPWLKLHAVGAQDGPNGGDKLTPAVFIQRINTAGGLAPTTGCAQVTDVGRKALVPYAADYVFYKYGNGDN